MLERAAAVDLDGVLLDGMQFHIAAWNEAFGGYGIVVEPRDLYLLEGIKSREVVERICTSYGLDLSAPERERVTATKRAVYKHIFEPVPLDGAGELLDSLFLHVREVAIVTGTVAAAAEATLTLLGARDRVAHIISADLEIPGKPDPAPFREASRRMNTIPSRCLAIDNAPPGITSAVAAGLWCVGVATYLPAVDLAEAVFVAESVRVLAAWLPEEYARSQGRGDWSLAS